MTPQRQHALSTYTARLRQAHRGGDANGRPGWWIGFSYDEIAIKRLKDAVPSDRRAWDGESKCWWVALEYEAQILVLFPEFDAYLKQGQLL